MTPARMSTLCGAGNEVGAATGAVLALGLTFFKVLLVICHSTHCDGGSATCFPALFFICLNSFILVHFSLCYSGRSLCAKQRSAVYFQSLGAALNHVAHH